VYDPLPKVTGDCMVWNKTTLLPELSVVVGLFQETVAVWAPLIVFTVTGCGQVMVGGIVSINKHKQIF